MGDLREEIARLRSLTPELNAVTDRAAKLVLAVEHFLNDECQLGIPTYVETNVEYSDDEHYRYGKRLEYSRWEGVFRLIVSDFIAHQQGEMEISERAPWVSSTRDRKLATIDAIPELLNKISQRVVATIRDANESAELVESYLTDLGIGEGKS